MIGLGGSAAHAVSGAMHTVAEILEIVSIVIVSCLGLAVVGGITFGVIKLRQHQRQGPRQAPPVIAIRQPATPLQSRTHTPALEQRLARIEALLLRDQPAEPAKAIDAAVHNNLPADRT